MRNRLLKYAVRVKKDPIGTRATARVGLPGVEDGELLIRAGIGQAEAFIVVKRMRVAVTADGLIVAVIVATLAHGFVDIGLPVADAAAGVDTGLTLRTDKEGVSGCG